MLSRVGGQISKQNVSVFSVRAFSSSVSVCKEQPLYLNPHKWEGLPADRIFELHNLRQTVLGDKYVPNDAERNAILSTVTELGQKTAPELEYVYALDHFKERHMNNTPVNLRGLPPQKTGIQVIKQGETAHKERKIEILNNISAFEMPLLSKFRQEYKPKSDTENPITLRYSDDFSDKQSKFNRKVTLICNIQDLQLNDAQENKFIILAGKRLDLLTGELRIASSSNPEAAQNAKWVVETFNKLLKYAKDLSDDFSDIPIDTRNIKSHSSALKPSFEFPEEWKRPEDSPVQKYKIVRKLIEDLKDKKDEEYLKAYSP